MSIRKEWIERWALRRVAWCLQRYQKGMNWKKSREWRRLGRRYARVSERNELKEVNSLLLSYEVPFVSERNELKDEILHHDRTISLRIRKEWIERQLVATPDGRVLMQYQKGMNWKTTRAGKDTWGCYEYQKGMNWKVQQPSTTITTVKNGIRKEWIESYTHTEPPGAYTWGIRKEWIESHVPKPRLHEALASIRKEWIERIEHPPLPLLCAGWYQKGMNWKS